jgi:hypothetical protein
MQAKRSTNHLWELRQNIKILKSPHVWVLAPGTITIEVATVETNSLYGTNTKKNSYSVYTGQSCSLFTSAVILGVQMGEKSKLGWLVRWSIQDMWADSLYFPYVVFGSVCKTFGSFQQHFVAFLYMWANFDFSSRPCVRLYLLLKAWLFHRCNICHNHMGCCTHTALLLGTSNWSSFHQLGILF